MNSESLRCSSSGLGMAGSLIDRNARPPAGSVNRMTHARRMPPAHSSLAFEGGDAGQFEALPHRMERSPASPPIGSGVRPFLAGLLVVLATLPVACKKPANPVAAAAPSSVPVVDTAEAIERARGGVVAVEQELTKRYLELDQRRLRLAKASPAEVVAYNRDAATYSADRAALQRRQESVKRLEQADVVRRQDVSGEEVSAQQTLGHLRAAITIGDWPAQVGAMEQALAQHRNTQTFAQISALAKPRLAAATYAELEKAMLKSAPAAVVAP